MNFLEEHLFRFKGFKVKYLENNHFYEILQKDREYQILSESLIKDPKNTFYDYIRNMESSFLARFTILMTGFIFIYQPIEAILSLMLNTTGLVTMLSFISALYFSNRGMLSFFKKIVPRFLYKDDEKRIKSILEKSKTKKYWADYFLDKKEFKDILKLNQTLIFTVCRKILFSNILKNQPEHKLLLTNLLSNWVEKGLSKEVTSNLVEFLVYPYNLQLFLRELKVFENILLTNEEKKELENLLKDSEKMLDNKINVQGLIDVYIDGIETSYEHSDINFFKDKDKKSNEKYLVKVAN